MKLQAVDRIVEECREFGVRDLLLLGSFDDASSGQVEAQFKKSGINIDINEISEVEKEISKFPLSLRSGNHIKNIIINAVVFNDVDGIVFCNPVLRRQFCPGELSVHGVSVPIIEP